MDGGDRNFIRSIQCQGRLGVSDRERRVAQKMEVDVELWVDLAPAAASDELADSVDYAAVVETVRAEVGQRPAVLLEKMAERVSRRLLQLYGVSRIGIEIRKFPADLEGQIDWVAVRLERTDR